MDQDSQMMNFEQYLTQACCIKVLAVSQINHRDMSNCIWLFRKCETTSAIKGQQSLFIDYQHIIRHIFLFLVMLIANHQNNDGHIKDLAILMKSICIIIKNQELILGLELENNNIVKLLQISFQKSEIIQLDGVNERTLQIFFTIWQDMKETKNQQLRNSLSSLQELASINFQMNCQQNEIIKLKKKELMKYRKRGEEQEQYRQISIKFCKLIHSNVNQLQLLPNGNLINGIFWKNNKTILSLSKDNNILHYFFQCSYQANNYETDEGFYRYWGPLNDYLEPDTKMLEIFEGRLESVSRFNHFLYKGAFKNGLFHGNGRIYKQYQLWYLGQLKNGLRSGMGYSLYQGDYFQYGCFQQNLQQGKFEWCRCINYTTREKVWEKQQLYNYYRNGSKINDPKLIQFNYSPEQTPATILFNFSEIQINNVELNSLRPGGWIDSCIVDIILSQARNLKFHMSGNYNNGVMYVNCSNFQEIFGSIITEESQLNQEPFKIIYQKEKPNKRIVFYFNLDCIHLIVVYENKKLYLIDQMTDTRECLLNQVTKLLKGQNLEVELQWAQLNQSKQQNSYDSGIYTIFFVTQLIKNEELSIQVIKERKLFNIQQSAINQIRHNIYQILMSNYSSIFRIVQ